MMGSCLASSLNRSGSNAQRPRSHTFGSNDAHHVSALDEDQRRLALALATKTLEPDPPQPVYEARPLAMFQREKWIWQIQVHREGRWKVACQMTSPFNKEAGMLRAEVVRILAACDVPKENINQLKNSKWLLCLDLGAD